MESVTKRLEFWPWAVCSILLLATMLNYMDRQALSVTLPTLKADFNLTENRIGWLEGCFGFSFAFGSIFFGWLADRWGPRYLYPAVLAGWSFAGIATAYAESPLVNSLLQSPEDAVGTGVFRWMLLCRMVLGVCEAGHWPCALLTVRAIMTDRDRTLGNGILQSGASIGAIIVPLYIELAQRLGATWSFPFWSIGVAGLLWVPTWFVLIGRRKLEYAPSSSGESIPGTQSLAPSEAENKDLVRRIVVLFVVVASLTVSWQFLRTWIVLYLQDFHQYSETASRLLNSGYFAAADVGCVLSGFLVTALVARGWQNHRARLLGFFLFSLLTACGALVPLAGSGWLMIALLFIAGAGILGLHPYYYSLAQELSATKMGMLSGSLAASGWVVSSVAQIYLGSHIAATKSYQLGLIIVGLAPFVGFAALLFFWPASSGVEKASAKQV